MSFLFRKIVALASPTSTTSQSKERTTQNKTPALRVSRPPPYSPPPPYHVLAAPEASPPSLLLAPVYEEAKTDIVPPDTPKMAPRELDWSPAMEKTERLWEEKLTAETQHYKEHQTTGQTTGHSQVPAISPWLGPTQPVRDIGTQERRPSSSGSASSMSSVESVSSRSSPGPSPAKSATRQTRKSPPTSISLPGPVKSKCRVSFENPAKPQATYMHPLFAWTQTRPNAPIFYDVSTPPPSLASTPTEEMKDFLDQPIPLCTLLEPATEPPVKGKMTLWCQELGWDVTVVPSTVACPPEKDQRRRSSSSSSTRRPSNLKSGGTASKKKFYIDHESAFSSDTEDEDDDGPYPVKPSTHDEDAVITNLDVLRSIHSSLSLPIAQADWTDLSEDDQKEVGKAYRKRCKGTQERGWESPKPGGVWAEGVKRVDFLKGKSVVVGIEANDSRRQTRSSTRGKGAVGRIVFAHRRKSL